MTVVVHPVPGLSIQGAPEAPLEVSKELATRLIRTGAFARERAEGGPETEPIHITEDDIPQLDFFDPPIPHGAHYLYPERVNPDRLEDEARAELERVLAKIDGEQPSPATEG